MSDKAETNRVAGSTIQLVCVKWGTKYTPDIINRLYRAALRHTENPIHFVCITDEHEGDYDQGIVLKPFPAFAYDYETVMASDGCKLKLSIFAPGLLMPDLPTIYVDLDTAIVGDVARLAEQIEQAPGLYILQNHYIQWWPIYKYVKPLIGERYYFGNSSILTFRSGEFDHIFTSFNEVYKETGSPAPKHLRSDERYISYCARDSIRVHARSLAVKFAEEYMLPFAWMEEIRKRLPWVIRRRSTIVAVTFLGNSFHPDIVAKFKPGDLLRYKRLRAYWDHESYSKFYQ